MIGNGERCIRNTITHCRGVSTRSAQYMLKTNLFCCAMQSAYGLV